MDYRRQGIQLQTTPCFSLAVVLCIGFVQAGFAGVEARLTDDAYTQATDKGKSPAGTNFGSSESLVISSGTVGRTFLKTASAALSQQPHVDPGKLRIIPPYEVSGTVFNEKGTGVAGIQINFEDLEERTVVASTVTGADGRFTQTLQLNAQGYWIKPVPGKIASDFNPKAVKVDRATTGIKIVAIMNK